MTQVVSVRVVSFRRLRLLIECPTLSRFLQWSAGTARGKFGYRHKPVKKVGLRGGILGRVQGCRALPLQIFVAPRLFFLEVS
jgi:hypothetical protein